MAQTVTINKASYPDVPYVLLNKTDGTGQAKYVDSSDATATSSDLRIGETAYINGEKVEGVIPETDSLSFETATVERVNFDVRFTSTVEGAKFLNDGATITQDVMMSEFGDVHREDVVAGKTFTSNVGIKATGELQRLDFTTPQVAQDVTETDTGLEFKSRTSKGYLGNGDLITLSASNSNVATAIGLNASQLPPSSSVLGMTGTYTTDANAAAGDLYEGKTAYVNGAKVTGTLGDASAEGATIVANPSTVRDDTGGGIAYDYTWTDSNAIVRTGNTFMMTATYEQVANAIGLTSDRLAPGGYVLGIYGTYTTDATATAADIVSGKTAYVNGTKVTGTMEVATSEQVEDMVNEVFSIPPVEYATSNDITEMFNSVFGTAS